MPITRPPLAGKLRSSGMAVAIALCTACAGTDCDRAATATSLEGELLDRSVPLDTADVAADPGLAALTARLGNVPLILIGEPNHGSHEPLAMRNRLIRHLVVHGRLTAVALETGLAESAELARFVAGEAGALPVDSARYVAGRWLTWGFGAFEENVELLRWLRTWNDDPSHARKVRFYGYDLSLGGPGAAYPTLASANGALAWLETRNAAAAQRFRLALKAAQRALPDKAEQLDSAARTALGVTIDSLMATVATTPPGTDAERERHAWALRQAIVAQQEHAMMLVVPPFDGAGLPPGAWRAMGARDSAMAANVRWIMEREGDRGRVLVFAHDMHVKRVPTTGGVFSALTRPARSMGGYLHDTLGDRMIVIGMMHGDSTPVSGASPLASLDSALWRLRRAPFVLSVHRKNGDATSIDDLLARTWAMRVNGDTFFALSPSAAFDHLVVLGTLHPATPTTGASENH